MIAGMCIGLVLSAVGYYSVLSLRFRRLNADYQEIYEIPMSKTWEDHARAFVAGVGRRINERRNK